MAHVLSRKTMGVHICLALLVLLCPHSAPARVLSVSSPSIALPGEFVEWQAYSELVALRGLSPRPFLFCALPKDASTLWKQMLLRAAGDPSWNTTNSTLIHSPVWSNLIADYVGIASDRRERGPDFMPIHGRIPEGLQNRSDLDAVFGARDPPFFKAVIVRDPVTRLLSAYLDRCVENSEWLRLHAHRFLSFEEAVEKLERLSTRELLTDIHFKPQAQFCGLRYVKYDAVGQMERREDARTILERAGLWDDFGKTGWGPGGISAFGEEFQASDNHEATPHGTSLLVCKYYTPALLERVRSIYHEDFELFGYDIASWQRQCASAWPHPRAASGQNTLYALT